MILWVDLETTGLDHKVGSILEIAVVATDDNLNELGTPFVSLVAPPKGRGIEVMDDYVIDMHTKNGLLDELYELSWKARGVRVREGVPDINTVDAKLEQWLDEGLGEKDEQAKKRVLRNTPLGGSSVHFDRKFMEECGFVRFVDRFSHRHIDVSAYNEGAKRWDEKRWRARPGVGPDGKPVVIAHRALADIRSSIEVAGYYRSSVFQAAPPLPPPLPLVPGAAA